MSEEIEESEEQEDLENQEAEPSAPEAENEEITGEEDVETLKQEVESLKQQVEENLDKALRTQADMENLRKRTVRDIEKAHKYALDKFIKELLPVIDSMELGISVSDNAEDITTLKEGMDLTVKMFLDALDKSGIEVIEPQGDKFDPERHEAVSMQEVEGSEPGTVVTVIQKGYSLNGRLVRPAMVVVAK